MWREVPSRSEECLPLLHRQVLSCWFRAQLAWPEFCGLLPRGGAPGSVGAPPATYPGRAPCAPRTELMAEIIASTPTNSVLVLIPAPNASLPSHLSRT